ncbi:MAG: hypothetical protein RL660_1703 [Bacteroidota bacterium]|jgi:hypothetical protein
MLEKNSPLIEAWREAAAELQLTIVAPFFLEHVEEDWGDVLLIENFGSKNGTLVFTIDNMRNIGKAEPYGFYCSALNPVSYAKYNREHFIETLSDWGYFGSSKNKPSWYKGHMFNQT